MQKIKTAFFLFLLFFKVMGYKAHAQDCQVAIPLYIGYQALARTGDDFILPSTEQLGEKEIIRKIQSSIESYNHHPQLASSKGSLAREMYLAARAWRVDPLAFSALIEKETDYGRDLMSSTAASGYTQMTGSALSELRDQYKEGPIKETLHEGAERYFQALSSDSFIDWISNYSSGKRKQYQSVLRNDGSVGLPYGLALGASLLRTYLSVSVVLSPYNNYNYSPHGYALALAMYNGDKALSANGYPTYLNYSRGVRSNLSELSQISSKACEDYEIIGNQSFQDSTQTLENYCTYIGESSDCEAFIETQFVPQGTAI